MSRIDSADSGASIESTFLRESQHDVHVLHGLARRAFAEVVERGEDVDHAVALRRPSAARCWSSRRAGRCGTRLSVKTLHERVVRVEARVERFALRRARSARAARDTRRPGCRAATERRAVRRRSAHRCRRRALPARSPAGAGDRRGRRHSTSSATSANSVCDFGLRPAPVTPLFASTMIVAIRSASEPSGIEREQRRGDVAAGVGHERRLSRSDRDSVRAARRPRRRSCPVEPVGVGKIDDARAGGEQRGRVLVRDLVIAGQEDDVARPDAFAHAAARRADELDRRQRRERCRTCARPANCCSRSWRS